MWQSCASANLGGVHNKIGPGRGLKHSQEICQQGSSINDLGRTIHSQIKIKYTVNSLHLQTNVASAVLTFTTHRPSTVSYFSYFFLLLSHFSYFLDNVLLLTKNSVIRVSAPFKRGPLNTLTLYKETKKPRNWWKLKRPCLQHWSNHQNWGVFFSFPFCPPQIVKWNDPFGFIASHWRFVLHRLINVMQTLNYRTVTFNSTL